MLRLRWAGLLACMLVMIASVAVADTNDARDSVVQVTLEKISLGSVNSDKVELNATVSVSSTKNVTLREVAFERLRINGVPFYASPINQRFVLVPGEKVMPSKPLLLTLYLRDLDSLKPLRALVAEGKLSVTGMAFADLSLNPAEKLLLLTLNARVPVPLDNTIELQFPGGVVAQTAALAVLDHLQSNLDTVAVTWKTTAKMFSQWRRQLWDEYAPALVLAHATYQLQDAQGKTFAFDSTATGFRVAGKQVLLPKSVLEPWKFDQNVAASMKKDSKLKVTGYDLWIWPANANLRDGANQLSGANAWRLSAHQIRLIAGKKDGSDRMLVASEHKPIKVSIDRRQGVAALGLVEIIDPAAKPMSPTLVVTGLKTRGSSVAVFRFPEGIAAKSASPDLIFVTGTPSASKLELDAMIDSSGWGSPVISQDGIVGIVTDENSVVPINDAAKAFKLNGTRQQASAGR